MTRQDFEQVAHMLHQMGFFVVQADLESETIVIKTMPVRS